MYLCTFHHCESLSIIPLTGLFSSTGGGGGLVSTGADGSSAAFTVSRSGFEAVLPTLLAMRSQTATDVELSSFC